RNQMNCSSLCGSCHDIVTSSGTAIERTFQEWQASTFAEGPGTNCPGLAPLAGETCSQCHMNQSKELQQIAQYPGVPTRRVHSHAFPGVDVALTPNFPQNQAQLQQVQSFLDSTLQGALCLWEPG